MLDNGPARKESFVSKMQGVAESVGEPMEMSTLRREDFNFIQSMYIYSHFAYVCPYIQSA